jgi:hypothetical protein
MIYKTNQMIISNSTPLIAFSKKQELSVLHELFGNIAIPQAVYIELCESNDNISNQKGQILQSINEGWIQVIELSKDSLLDFSLGSGETEVINLGINHQNALLLIDEKKGRLVAKSYKLKVLGTLGILALLVQRKLKTKNSIKENLRTLLQAGFYLSSDLVLTFLAYLDTID